MVVLTERSLLVLRVRNLFVIGDAHPPVRSAQGIIRPLVDLTCAWRWRGSKAPRRSVVYDCDRVVLRRSLVEVDSVDVCVREELQDISLMLGSGPKLTLGSQ